jgi:Rps23 Pro-64 3,4-dihydroxylase Tpa1-like proline 4-hydroxylase
MVDAAMAAAPYCILDDFLPESVHQELLAHCLAVGDFDRGKVIVDGELAYHPDLRQGYISRDRLGRQLMPFRVRMDAAFAQIATELGIKPFKYNDIEFRLAAHGDGDFFKPHRDTFVGKNRPEGGDRLITAVYYLHAQPRGFRGGVLRIHPFGPGEPVAVQPVSNRLVAFPSFAIHEVSPVEVPSGAFADSRFSVTTWFRRVSTPS